MNDSFLRDFFGDISRIDIQNKVRSDADAPCQRCRPASFKECKESWCANNKDYKKGA